MSGWRYLRWGLLLLVPVLVSGAVLGSARTQSNEEVRGKAVTGAGLPSNWGDSSTAGMVWVEGDEPVAPDSKEEGGRPPQRGFWMDRTEVTFAQYDWFVRHTGYVTHAERGGGAVFHRPTQAEYAERTFAWWTWEEGANFRHPDGPSSNASLHPSEPVVQVTFEDALAYAHWLGRELPSEQQWEYAATERGKAGLLARLPRDAAGKPLANFWQGAFPFENTAEDGFASRAAVGSFPPNGLGLFDLIGNVWEWTRDVHRGTSELHTGDPSASVGALGTRGEEPRVIKGGSFLCASNFCARYQANARYPQEPGLPTAHVGFRTVFQR